MTWLAILGAILKLSIMALEEVFSSQARARARNEKWDASQQEIAKAFSQAVDRFKRDTIADNGKDIQDQIDDHLKPKP